MSHLGGHLNVTHLDVGALKWLQSRGTRTFLDIGCSVGGQLEAALMLGFEAWGFDGDYNLVNYGGMKCLDRVFFNDLTRCSPQFPIQFDAIWCVEVAEHIEERYTKNLLGMCAKNLRPGGTLVFTANDGPGVHHVNRKPVQWWLGELARFGLAHSAALTAELKKASTMEREFIQKTGVVCEKRA